MKVIWFSRENRRANGQLELRKKWRLLGQFNKQNREHGTENFRKISGRTTCLTGKVRRSSAKLIVTTITEIKGQIWGFKEVYSIKFS